MYCQECLREKSAVIGVSPKFGEAYRCRDCGNYWCIKSSRLFEDVNVVENSSKDRQTKVFYGAGELGLANLILCSILVVDLAILDEI